MHQTFSEILGTAKVWIIQTAQHACVALGREWQHVHPLTQTNHRRMHCAARCNTGLLNKLTPKGVVFSFVVFSSMHANCRKHQTTALLQTISISLKLATNSNHQLISSSRIQPEIPQAFLLLGCHGELFEVEDDVSKVMHPEAVGGRAVALPSVLGSLLHAPVCVGLQHTYCVRLKEKSTLHLSAIIKKLPKICGRSAIPKL